MSVQVLDATGATQTVETLPSVGQKTAANSLPVVLASDQAALSVTTGGLTDTQLRAASVVVQDNSSRPATGGFAATASASPLATPTRAIYVGGTGNITVTMSGSSVTFTAVPAGTLLPIVATHITALTATNVVGLT